MAQYKRLLFIFLTTLISTLAQAENGINSPYSRFGLGTLSDQNLGVNRQMGGLGYALRDKSYINLLNPAAVSSADSTTMIFEGGFSFQNGNFKEGDTKMNVKNASFDYLAMSFRLRKNLGFAMGILPYSNVGYSFGSNETILSPDGDTNGSFSSIYNYNGSGGLTQPFVTIGWGITDNFSIGVTASYLYGDITHSISNEFTDNNISNRARQYNINVSNYKADFGLQYSKKISEKHSYILGAVYSLGHDLNADAQLVERKTTSGVTEYNDTTSFENAFKLPHTFGVGVTYTYNGKWTIGADYTFQKWSESSFFGDNKGCDRSKISLGLEYNPNKISRNVLKRTRYRAGVYYAQPYTEFNGKKGCEEYGISAGFSLPMTSNNNMNNNRSLLNVSGQFVRINPKTDGMITETYLRLNIGITFNEFWFFKTKVN
ncbi:MAG: hypothetical protein E7089_04990 [Bacteroidales bacterium]|nr:hypothetical protein [Bacteroidales bacterium]MBR2606790.1 hypothetical protein [Bacteroidaceae bacterium]